MWNGESLTFLDSLDRRGDPCVTVVDKDRKYVLTLYGQTLDDKDAIRAILIDCLAHAAVLDWIDKHGEEEGFGEVCGQHQQAGSDKPGASSA